MNIPSPMKPRRLVSVLGIEIVSASSSAVLNSTRRAVVLRDPVLAVCAHRHRSLRQSTSASRRTASHVGFLLLSQLAERPERTRRSQVHGARRPNPKNEPAGDSARRNRAPGYGDFANVEGACGGA